MSNAPAPQAVSYAKDIQPLFRPSDISSMKRARGFDLAKYADVVARADRILERLEAGDMPCDAAWPQAKVQLFADWIKGGKQP